MPRTYRLAAAARLLILLLHVTGLLSSTAKLSNGVGYGIQKSFNPSPPKGFHNLLPTFSEAMPSDLSQHFDLNVSKLDMFHYQTAVRTLLKLKAKQLLRNAPPTAKFLYEECRSDAKTPQQQARCVVRLMDGGEAKTERPAVPNEANPLAVLFEQFRTGLWNPSWARKKRSIGFRRAEKYALHDSREGAEYENSWRPSTSERRRGEWMPKSLCNLERVQSYMRKADFCRRYMKELGDEGSRYLKGMRLPTSFKTRQPSPFSAIERIVDVFKGKAFKQISILSPRLLPLFPRERQEGQPVFMSPDLFSFHDEGVLPIKGMFESVLRNRSESLAWMDLVMRASGAARQLDDILLNNRDEVEFVESVLYPRVLELRADSERWRLFRARHSAAQQRELAADGYTFMSAEQAELIYGAARADDFLSRAQKERRLEERIRQIADSTADHVATPSTSFRVRRQITESPDAEHHGPKQLALSPWAFEQRIGGGVAFEGVTLSPHAFTSEIVSPEAFTFHVLSPRAFVATVLSPMALFARILAPAAFRAEILAPQALSAYILTPEALIAEVLSPKFMDLRVGSPRALSLQVLSPAFLSPRIASAEVLGVYVLSPNILSPHILSDGQLNVEVLSPHILSGHGSPGHDTEESHHFSPEHHHEHGDNAIDHALGTHNVAAAGGGHSDIP